MLFLHIRLDSCQRHVKQPRGTSCKRKCCFSLIEFEKLWWIKPTWEGSYLHTNASQIPPVVEADVVFRVHSLYFYVDFVVDGE